MHKYHHDEIDDEKNQIISCGQNVDILPSSHPIILAPHVGTHIGYRETNWCTHRVYVSCEIGETTSVSVTVVSSTHK